MIRTRLEVIKFLAQVCTDDYLDSMTSYKHSIGAHQEYSVKNSQATALWDMRYNTFINYSATFEVVYAIIRRGGLWTAIAVYDPRTKELFLVFKEKNLKEIMKQKSNSHYLLILNTINDKLKAHAGGEQLNLFDNDSPDAMKLENYRKQLHDVIAGIGIMPDTVIVFGFESNYEKRFKAYIFNSNQELVYQKDYSDLIESDFTRIPFDDGVQPTIFNEERSSSHSIKPSIRIKGLK